MTLDALGNLAEIAGLIGLIVSLLFVGWEIRANRKQSAMEFFHKATERAAEVRSWLYQDPELAGIVIRIETKSEDVSATDRLKYSSYISGLFDALDFAVAAHNRGLVDTADGERIKYFALSMIGNDHRLDWYQRHKHAYSAALRALMDNLIAELGESEAQS